MLTCSRCGYYNSDISTRCEQCNARLTVANAEPARHTATPTREAPPEALLTPNREPEYGGFWVRFVAVIIDGFIVSFGTALVAGFLPIFALPALILAPALYEIIMEAQSGATLGKRVFGLRVVTADTLQPISIPSAVIRHFGHYVSGAVFLLGYIMAGLNRRKRALHDYMAGTVVIKDRP